MPADPDATDGEPSSNEYSTAWVAYALQAMGVFGFVIGPLIGLVLSYVRRDAAGAGFIASHHRWLIRTFWWTLLWYLVCLAVVFAGAWPIISEVVREAIRSGGNAREFSFGIAWETIFATVGAAMLGGLGIIVVWIWNLYRIVRGGFRLADRGAVP
jgi:uncharacterized membrane protein